MGENILKSIKMTKPIDPSQFKPPHIIAKEMGGTYVSIRNEQINCTLLGDLIRISEACDSSNRLTEKNNAIYSEAPGAELSKAEAKEGAAKLLKLLTDIKNRVPVAADRDAMLAHYEFLGKLKEERRHEINRHAKNLEIEMLTPENESYWSAPQPEPAETQSWGSQQEEPFHYPVNKLLEHLQDTFYEFKAMDTLQDRFLELSAALGISLDEKGPMR